jgi:putative CocE/NonD family hydrolase
MTAQHEQEFELIWGVRIPMRDSVHLHGTVYKPRTGQPMPVIFTLTPYHADTWHDRAAYFARHGYVYVLVDHRGRGNSEGSFVPIENAGQDGHDVVEWLSQQPWCDGQVAMWGGSYAGLDQWLALKEFPAHLKTIVPAAAPIQGYDFPYNGGIGQPYWMQWLTQTSGRTTNWNLFYEQAFWIQTYRELYLNHIPFCELERLVGNSSVHFQTWTQHLPHDPYWKQFRLTSEQYRQIEIPILSIAGQYDSCQLGQLYGYQMHMQWGSPEACARHYLVIGPWDHAGTRTPTRDVGGVKFGEAALVDLNQLHTEWYDWVLKGGPKPKLLRKRVAYYVMGAEEWRYADDLESIADTRKRFYLSSTGGQASGVFRSGGLDKAPPARTEPDQYVYDPLDTRPAELERDEIKDYLTDQRHALALFGNGLVYHSAAFESDTEVTGCVRLIAWISLDVPDTDFQVTLSEILQDGSHIELTHALLRARYRESLDQEKLVPPGEIIQYRFDGFNFFSRRIAKGSRLRLLIRCANSIFLQKNYNSGGVVAEESAQDARTAHVTLYHDEKHPSYLELPIVTRQGRA